MLSEYDFMNIDQSLDEKEEKKSWLKNPSHQSKIQSPNLECYCKCQDFIIEDSNCNIQEAKFTINEGSQNYERIHSQNPWENEEEISSYKYRKDVICKAIFRSFRKFYIKDFRLYYDYSHCKKEENTENSGPFYENLKEYVSFWFQECNNERMVSLLMYIIDSKEKYFTISPESFERKNKIKELIYSYNKYKLESCYSDKEFLTLLNSFIESPDIISRLLKGANNLKLVKQYKKYLKFIQNWDRAS